MASPPPVSHPSRTSPALISHPSPSSSSDVEEEEAEPEAKVARLCPGEQLIKL